MVLESLLYKVQGKLFRGDAEGSFSRPSSPTGFVPPGAVSPASGRYAATGFDLPGRRPSFRLLETSSVCYPAREDKKLLGQHDSSYHLFFSHARMIRDLLHEILGEAWVSLLDLASPERVPSSFTSRRAG